jgi:hypothetical protein
MATWVWIVVAVVIVVVVLALVASLVKRRRTRQGLQERFGPEYDRTVDESGGERAATSELREREKRHEEFDIRPLEPQEAERYRAEWVDVQAKFVDDPALAVGEADRLIMSVMEARGYPVEDFETRASDLSVEHPAVVEHYRTGHRLADDVSGGDESTETLRQAMQHFRALFDELVEPAADEPTARDETRPDVAGAGAVAPSDAADTPRPRR